MSKIPKPIVIAAIIEWIVVSGPLQRTDPKGSGVPVKDSAAKTLSQTHIKLNPPVTNACVKEHQFTLYLLLNILCIIANNTALTIAIYLDDCDQFGASVTSSNF